MFEEREGEALPTVRRRKIDAQSCVRRLGIAVFRFSCGNSTSVEKVEPEKAKIDCLAAMTALLRKVTCVTML